MPKALAHLGLGCVGLGGLACVYALVVTLFGEEALRVAAMGTFLILAGSAMFIRAGLMDEPIRSKSIHDP